MATKRSWSENHNFEGDILAGSLKVTVSCHFQRIREDVQKVSDLLRGGHSGRLSEPTRISYFWPISSCFCLCWSAMYWGHSHNLKMPQSGLGSVQGKKVECVQRRVCFINEQVPWPHSNRNVKFCTSRLCMQMSSFLFVRAWAMPRILYLSCGVPFPV